jgi:integrase
MATFTQLPSGKWRVQVRQGGLYKGATFKLKREAQAWAVQVESQAHSLVTTGYQSVPSGYTVAKLIDAYIEDTNPHYKRLHCLKRISRDVGHFSLSKLNAAMLNDYVTKRLKTGIQGVTLAYDLSTLSAVLKYGKLVKKLNIDSMVARDARASMALRKVETRSTEREREPTDHEMQALYTHWEANERLKLPMADLCRFALATAMRQGEICRITIEDVNRQNKTVVIRDRKDPLRKVGNHMTVPLLPEAWEIAIKHIGKRTAGKIFENCYERSVSASFTRTCIKLKIKDLHFHDLRHRAIRQLFSGGLAIPEVSLLSGHKNWKILARYVAVQPSEVHEKFARSSHAS